MLEMATSNRLLHRGPTSKVLALSVFKKINQRVFDGRLKNVSIIWTTNINIRSSGRTVYNHRTKQCYILLSVRLLNNNQYGCLFGKIIHEMCHAAVYVINKRYRKNHGKPWIKWMQRVYKQNPRARYV
ncbi:XE-like protein [Helicoverpa armigera multiple nucleopolyhedrovirus]|uniref:Xe n=1 Tax=Mamestra brassicae nuclear polyhedrosis virus TaxID=78219 RepID=J7HAJ0_NPVMB|nr:XE-like protein [Helicoverpa armigera multiple nucleopolyhedrovirus]AFP95734.1 xe [Mamestra brassicae multiple nucleopolyhedrovirus]AIL25092.1 xe1 [Mamestra brassicae multiple nucleopolyhedrovirus]WNA17394.1 xe [Alphabaculovirus mabrassicae]